MSKLSIAHIAAEKDYSHFELASPNPSNGRWEINFINVTAFFIERGYYIYRTSVDKWILIRIIDNIVKQVGKKDLKDELINYITQEEDESIKKYMHQFFLKNISKAVSDDFLETLPAKEIGFKRDKKDAMQIYYQNCIVKITKDKISFHEYAELDGYIWESQILPRSFKATEISPYGEFATFIFNIAKSDPARVETICSALGYHIHNYKHASYCPATILNDEVISANPEGGTGKGIIYKALPYFLECLTIDGKTFSFESNFLYQRITPETRMVIFQDVGKNFDFERLFSFLTEGVVTEKKGQDQQFISFTDAPKVGITTNYAIKGAGNSHERRRFEIEISQFYNGQKTPETEFGHLLFDDWDEKQWAQFDNYIVIACCQFFLQKGLVKQELVNLPEKRLINLTNLDFVTFMREIDFNFEITLKGYLLTRFMEAYEDYVIPSKYFSKHMFRKWVDGYAAHFGYKVEDHNDGINRYYKFIKNS